MATKIEYLKLAIKYNIIEDLNWYYYCFAIPVLKLEEVTDKKIAKVFTKPDGLYFINENTEEEKIIDYEPNKPLYKFSDIIEVDSSYSSYITSKFETKIGNLIFNTLILFPSFKNKLPYINEPIKISKLETIIANKVKNKEEATEKDIIISELVTFIDRLGFLTNLANIVNIAATYKSITPPENIKEKKKELLEKYKDQLHNPVKVIELENELDKIDKEYLADDPAAKNIFNRKSKIARKKMFLMFGNPLTFDENTSGKAILTSLSDGLNTKEDIYPYYMNDLRVGSFSRGSKTALGGYIYKILQRSISPIKIVNSDCGTKRGLKRKINDKNVSKLINRYIIENKDWKLIETIDEAKKYIGKKVEIRSSMYCQEKENKICYKCVSENYKNLPDGTTIILSDLSAIILSLFMKLIHGLLIENTEIDIEDLVN